MKILLPVLLLAALPGSAIAQTVFINETFETDTIGQLPTDPALRRTSLVSVAAGSGVIGTSNVVHFNDNSNTTAGVLEYNVGESAQSVLYVKFDVMNNIPNPTGTAANPLIFGIGAWNDTTSSSTLGSNANRAVNVEFYASGSSSTVRLRSGGNTLGSNTTYDMSELQSVQVWINDHQTNAVSYTRPDNYQTATLAANSVVIWINNVLIGGGTDAGFGLQSTFTTGVDASLGRIGFNSTQANVLDFSIDNIYVATAAPIPEPSTYAAIVGALALGLVAWRRRRTA